MIRYSYLDRRPPPRPLCRACGRRATVAIETTFMATTITLNATVVTQPATSYSTWCEDCAPD